MHMRLGLFYCLCMLNAAAFAMDHKDPCAQLEPLEKCVSKNKSPQTSLIMEAKNYASSLTCILFNNKTLIAGALLAQGVQGDDNNQNTLTIPLSAGLSAACSCVIIIALVAKCFKKCCSRNLCKQSSPKSNIIPDIETPINYTIEPSTIIQPAVSPFNSI